MRLKQLLSILLILGVMAGGCSENGSGPDHGEPPAIPDLSKAKPDISFFENNNVGTSISSVQSYSTAQLFVQSAAASFALLPTFVTYMQQFNPNEAEYSDGKWVWEYQGAENTGLKLTAQNNGTTTVWKLYFSDGSTESFKAVDGSIKNDGSSGVWHLYDFKTGNVILESEFTITSSTEKDYTMTIYDEETGSSRVILTFDVDVPVHILTWDEIADDNDMEVYWNTDTKVGYFADNGDETTSKQCWNGSLNDVSCSEVGL